MTHNQHHDHILTEVTDLYSELLKKSPQAIYVYLDDEHKICNEKYAALLGYKNPNEWVKNPYPLGDVDPNGQQEVINAYILASEKLKTSTIKIKLITKKGKNITTSFTMTPFVYKGETFVIHYISKIS